jgi:hypothetical protein
VFAVDPAMKVTSTTHTLAEQEEVHGMASWTVHELAQGSTLELAFQGGHEHAPQIAGGGAGGGEAGGPVQVISGQSEPFSRYLMVTLGLVLATLAFVALRGASDPLKDHKVLSDHYNLLVTRLARLDDLRATGTISNDAHQAARANLMSRLGVIAMRLRTPDGAEPVPPTQPEAASHAVKHTQAS